MLETLTVREKVTTVTFVLLVSDYKTLSTETLDNRGSSLFIYILFKESTYRNIRMSHGGKDYNNFMKRNLSGRQLLQQLVGPRFISNDVKCPFQ